MTEPVAKRGDVWFADDPGDKRRPVLVLTRDPLGGILHSVHLRSRHIDDRGLSTEVALGRAEGLKHDSVANFDNLFLLPGTT